MYLPDQTHWQRLSPLLDELLDLPDAARTARLDALRTSEPGVAGEAESWLLAMREAEHSGFLAGVAAGAPAASVPGLAGQRLGAYRIVAPLGQGGSGSVWRARRDDGQFEGEVAIKLLHWSLLGHQSAERFRREGAILARLTHPHIAHLLDAGVSDTGQPYLVLELAQGERIDQYCDARRLTVEQRVVLFGDVLAAVTHAHRHLVIHRDIKPTNILVTAQGQIKLLDFGIAKFLEEHGAGRDRTPLTREGTRALTPEYAAPEQMRGEAVTTATDVYALGVLLFQLLCGRHPTSPEGGTAAQVMRATLDAQPARLSLVPGGGGRPDAECIANLRGTSPARLRRQLAGDLENILARALRKDPAERYATADALADDLRRYLAHQPVSARPDSLAYRLARFVQRNRTGVAAGLVAGVAVAAGIAGTLTQGLRAQREAQHADQQAQQAGRERDKALAELRYSQAADDLLRFVVIESSGQPQATPEKLDSARRMIERRFGDDVVLRTKLQLLLAELYEQALEVRRAEALVLHAQGAIAGVGDVSLTARVNCTLARLHDVLGRGGEARQSLDAEIAHLRSRPDAEPEAIAGCLSDRSHHFMMKGESAAMRADAEAALAYFIEPRPHQRVTVANLRSQLALGLGMSGEGARAVALNRQVIAELDALGRGQTPQAMTEVNNLGWALLRFGQPQQAAEMLEGARGSSALLQLPLRGALELNHARALLELGRTREATALGEVALDTALATGDAFCIGNAQLGAAQVACGAGDWTACARRLAEARATLRPVIGPKHATHGLIELVAARVALARKDVVQGRELLRAAVRMFDAAADGHPQRINALVALVALDLADGNVYAAARAAGDALAQARRIGTGFEHSAWLGIAQFAQARVELARGDANARTTLAGAVAELRASLGSAAPLTREAEAFLASARR